MNLHDVVGALDVKDENRETPLDCAIRSASSGIAKHLLDQGCAPTKPYSNDLNCSGGILIKAAIDRSTDPIDRFDNFSFVRKFLKR